MTKEEAEASEEAAFGPRVHPAQVFTRRTYVHYRPDGSIAKVEMTNLPPTKILDGCQMIDAGNRHELIHTANLHLVNGGRIIRR